MKKLIGVIGGMGPMATSRYMELLIMMTDAEKDQDHLDMIIYNIASVPDRTEHILDNKKESPLPKIISIRDRLIEGGAQIITMPCVTAHFFADDIKSGIGARFISMPDECAAYLIREGVKKAGIMATDGTVSSGLFQKALEKEGIKAVLPDENGQKDVMHLIYDNIKSGIAPEMDRFYSVTEELKREGAEVIILGCTELSLIKRSEDVKDGVIDAMEVLAKCTIEEAGARLNKEYDQLITGR